MGDAMNEATESTEPKKRRWISEGGGIYRDANTKKLFHRPLINGKRTFRLLKVHTVKKARALKGDLDSSQTMHANGLEKDPYAAPACKVSELIEGYKAAGCPCRDESPREGVQLDQELSRLKFLEPFWGMRQADQIKPVDCLDYGARRKKSMKAGCTGHRAIDMEINTLVSVLRWAQFHRKIDVNPLAGPRIKFRKGKEIKHCRDCMPKDAAELHSLARALFEDPRSEVLGWQLLLEAMTGLRTSEVLRLRWDAATSTEAGFIDGQHLWLNRSKKGIKPWCEIHPALAEVLEALRNWRVWREKTCSPWFLPSARLTAAGGAVDPNSLCHALNRIAPLISKARRTSHGLRAYYVTVRRSMGITDLQIADEIGDKTGGSIIETTYGAIPDNFRGGNALGWTVEKPAWEVLEMPANLSHIGAAVAC